MAIAPYNPPTRRWEKLLVLAGMTFASFIVSLLLFWLVHDRQDNFQTAVNSITEPWGRAQTISSPVLYVPCSETVNNKIVTSKALYILPDSLRIRSEVAPEVRSRNIFKTTVYRSRSEVSGQFQVSMHTLKPMEGLTIHWDQAAVAMIVRDPVGIKAPIRIQLDTTKLTLGGSASLSLFNSYTTLQAPYPIRTDATLSFSTVLELNGSESIDFLPLGMQNDVQLTLGWGDPSFHGRMLPDERSVSDSVTTAHWRTMSINRTFAPGSKYQLIDEAEYREHELDEDTYGVKLMTGNDTYALVLRALKYAVLLILFTFISFFFADSLTTDRIPYIGYLLVGVAILIFFTLLLSISEYLGFSLAYLIAGVATIGLIIAYVRGYLGSSKAVGVVCGIEVILYGLLYLLLNMENFTLLVGSIFLFVVLGVVMYLTRRIEW